MSVVSATWPAPAARRVGWPVRSVRIGMVPLALLLTAIPLLWPTIPPLLDLPNHMSRYAIALDYARSADFQRWFEFHWSLFGNLGVDLLVAAIGPLLGVEAATKLAVLAIPLATVAGLALVAREIHGRVPATAPFAFVFAYNHPFNFGFVNFCLAAALALLVYGGWLWLGRIGRRGLRIALLLPAGFVVWLAHACGWGMLGVMLFASELTERRAAGQRWAPAGLAAALTCAPLAAVLLPMLLWARQPGFAGQFLYAIGFDRKLVLLMLALKNGTAWVDIGSMLLEWLVVGLAVLRRDLCFDRRLVAVAAALGLVFLAMPDELAGSGYVDLRLAPYPLAILLLAIRPAAASAATRTLGMAALAFLALRTGYLAASYARLDRAYAAQLEALDHLPRGTRVFGLAQVDCLADWNGTRMDHVNRLAIVRRAAYTNDTWPAAAAQTATARPALVAGYPDLDSQKLYRPECRFGLGHTVPDALARMPRDRFDYLWLIDVPPARWPRRSWLRPVWHGPRTALYRIVPVATAG